MGIALKHSPALSGRPLNPFDVRESIRRECVLGYRAVQVLQCLRAAGNGPAPSYDMICDELGLGGKDEVSRIIKGLIRRGVIVRTRRGNGRGHRSAFVVVG